MKLELQSYIKGLIKDPFWLVMVILAVLCLIFFFLDILPLWGKIRETQGELQNQEKQMDRIIKEGPDVPTKQWVKEKKKYKKVLEEETGRIKDFYKETDKNIEAWFPALNCSPEKTPNPGAFIPRYQVRKDELITLLKGKGIKIGSDAEEDSWGVLGGGNPNKDDHRILQKRFWIQKRIIEDMVKSNVIQCKKITFSASAGGEKRRKTGSEGKIPEGIATTIIFELQVVLFLKNVPELVYNLVEYSKESPLIIIEKIEISRVVESIEKTSEEFVTKKIKESEKETWRPPEISLPMIQLTLTGKVLDFEIN